MKYALRSLLRTPLFAATAVAILALSVGATTAVFSMLHALVLRPLPVPHPHELVQVSVFNHRGQITDMTWRQYRELVARQGVFSTIFTSIQQGVFTVETERTTLRGSMSGVSGNYYRELGARPALGRLIEPSDVNEAAMTGEPIVVLSWEFWQREFGGDPSVVGRTLKADGEPLTIVGVAPRGFLGLSIAIDHDVTVPITLVPKISQSEASMVEGTSSWVATTGRLRPGITLAQARAQIETMWPELLRAAAPVKFLTSQREEYLARRVSVDSGATGWERGLRGRYTRPLFVLQAIAALVLLIAGANLCALIFARAEARRHELGVRLALGASRLRLVRELTAEGALIGIAGAATGLALAGYASEALTSLLLRDYTVRTAVDVSPTPIVVGLAAVAGIGVAATVAATAAWLVTRKGTTTLSPGASRTVARPSRVGRVLVGAQIALSIVLLSHASLLSRSVYAIVNEDTGLTRDTILVSYPTERVGAYRRTDSAIYYPQLLERLRALPGVAAAGISTFPPEGSALPAEFVGRAGTPIADGDLTAEMPLISPGFLDTMGVAIVRGRDITFADNPAGRKVVIISEELERRLFGSGRGLGERIRVSRRPEWQDAEIVGIARDARMYDVRGGNRAIAYAPAIQTGQLALYKFIVVRAPESAATAIVQAVNALGVEYATRVQTLEYRRNRTLLQERLMAWLSGFFAVLALLLVSVGVYGLLSYVLSLRRKEFGIRLALGAKPGRIAAQVAGGVGLVTAVGLVAGLGATAMTAPLLRSVLVGTSPYDPIAIGGASIVLLIGGALAAAAPALRASRVEPVAELRRD